MPETVALSSSQCYLDQASNGVDKCYHHHNRHKEVRSQEEGVSTISRVWKLLHMETHHNRDKMYIHLLEVKH